VKRALLVALLCVPALAPSAVEGQGLYSRDAPKQKGAPSWLKELAALPPFTPPRLPDGTPNLQGMWSGPNGGDDIEEHDYVSARALRADGPARRTPLHRPADVLIEDPTVYTRPWKMRLPLRRGRSEEIWENACYEGNHDAGVARELGYKWFPGVAPVP